MIHMFASVGLLSLYVCVDAGCVFVAFTVENHIHRGLM